MYGPPLQAKQDAEEDDKRPKTMPLPSAPSAPPSPLERTASAIPAIMAGMVKAGGWPASGFILVLGPPQGGGWELARPKKASVPGAARKFLDRFGTNPEENVVCACPRRDGLKRKSGSHRTHNFI